MNTLQPPAYPPRSKLYHLAPCNVETMWRESLTGYLNRLARTHHISPRALIADMILPQLDIQLPFPRLTQLGMQGMGLNGALSLAQAWAAVLEQLTARPDLHLLTLPWWIGDLSRFLATARRPCLVPVLSFCLAKAGTAHLPAAFLDGSTGDGLSSPSEVASRSVSCLSKQAEDHYHPQNPSR